MEQKELRLEKIISKLNMLKAYLKVVHSESPFYFRTPEFEESMAEARAELDICIKELTDAWIKGEF